MDWSQQLVRSATFAMLGPQLRQSRCRAEFPGFGFLGPSNRDCRLQAFDRCLALTRVQQRFCAEMVDSRLPPAFTSLLYKFQCRPEAFERLGIPLAAD